MRTLCLPSTAAATRQRPGWRLTLCGLLLTGAAAPAQVADTNRLFLDSWRNAGVEGGIPCPARIVNVMDYGAQGNGTSNDVPAYVAAVAALGGRGGVVYFPAGKYLMANSLTLPSNTVIRGERPATTELAFTNIGHCITLSKGQAGGFQSLQGGYGLHSRTLEVTNAAAFQAGDYAEIRETNAPEWQASDWAASTVAIGQMIRIAGVASNTLTLHQPLRLGYRPDLNPQIRRVTPLLGAGVESLRLSRRVAGADATARDNLYTVYLNYTANCWVRGCEITNVFGAAIGADFTTRCEISGNYLHDAVEFDGGGSGYGISLQYRTGQVLVRNNIIRRMRHALLTQAGANGNVFAYNYLRDQYKDEGVLARGDFVADMVCHGNYTHANLFEGNCGAYIDVDSSHGANGPHNTFLRNRARGTTSWGLNQAVEINDPLCVNQTFVGNEAVGSYGVARTGTFEYGNNDDGTVKPAGTAVLPDVSYCLGDTVTNTPPRPDWWTVAALLPVYGPTAAGTLPAIGIERDIPARARWSASVRTYAPPSLSRVPTNQWAWSGQPVVLAVAASGEGAVSYQWLKDGVALDGQTNDTLTFPAVSVSDQAAYSVVVSDAAGSVTTEPAGLYVLDPGGSTFRWTQNGAFLDLPDAWDPPAGGPPGTNDVGIIGSGSGSITSVFRRLPPATPAQLLIVTGGVLALSAAVNDELHLVLDGGTLRPTLIVSNNSSIALRGPSVLSSGGFTLSLYGPIQDHPGSAGRLVISNGAGAVAFRRAGNTYSGGTEVHQGTLVCSASQALGLGDVAVSSGAVLSVVAVAASGPASTITVASNAVVQVNTSYTTNITVQAGGIIRGLAGGNRTTYDSLRLEGPVTLLRQAGSGYVYWRGPFRDGVEPGQLNVSGTNGFPIFLAATNTFSGGLRILDGGPGAGDVVVAVNNALPDAAVVTVDPGAQLTFTNVTDTIATLSGEGTVRLFKSVLTLGDTNDTVFAGSVTGTGGLTKQGRGTLTLTGTSTYAGPTAVTGGVLRVDGSLSPSTNAVTVYGTAFVGGTGTISRTLALRAGGGFDWGRQPGPLTVATNLAFPTGGLFRLSFDALTAARVAVQGTLTLPAAATLSLVPLPGGEAGPATAPEMPSARRGLQPGPGPGRPPAHG